MSIHRRALVGLLGTSAAVAAIGVSAAVIAPAAQAAPPPGAIHLPRHLSHHRKHDAASSSWAGYAVAGGTYHSVTGNWTVPALNCSVTSGDVSFWSGIDGYGTSTVEQIGIDAVCNADGTSEYDPWVEMYPADSIYFAETVKAGDKMTSAVTTPGNGTFTLTLGDTTQAWKKTYTFSTTAASISTAEVIVEAIGDQSSTPPTPDFGTIMFTHVTANGTTFAKAGGTVYPTDLERNGVVMTKESPFSKTYFATTWLHD
ncbi:MAG TPA: G1 family glutamic endopeptidase [Actinospica sp.]|nr:G1 family glutamic endopeptidase [Actinospica sp.]